MRISDWSSDVCSSDLDLILERLVEQQILLAFLEGHLRAGGRELVGVEIINLLPVEAVGGDFLVEDARGDREPLGGFPAQRHAAAIAFAAVDEIGRAHVRTPVTNAHLVCRLLLDTKIPTELPPSCDYEHNH